jgi:hypothetical protein
MNILEQHERLEMETLDHLRRGRHLDAVVFGGGTMLRLCHQLPRYSVDLDFFLKEPAADFSGAFKAIVCTLRTAGYDITDEAEKHFSWLVEFRTAGSPRRLKIEIRKEPDRAQKRETGIAFSPFAPALQVRLAVCTLAQMWRNKVAALLDRKEIRDAYDLEFLMRRGAGGVQGMDRATIAAMRDILAGFTVPDFRSKLGNLLPKDERERLSECRFALLGGALVEASS